jgi:hypothetical protein
VSGLTGVYFEKLLKQGPTQASVWIRNVQLSFYSLIAALLGGVIWQDGEGIREHGFFEGYNWVVWTAVGLQAAGGLVASLVIRDADNIVKNFATSISIVISMLVSVVIFDFTVTWTVSAPPPHPPAKRTPSSSPSMIVDSQFEKITVPLRHRPRPLLDVSIQRSRATPTRPPPTARPHRRP